MSAEKFWSVCRLDQMANMAGSRYTNRKLAEDVARQRVLASGGVSHVILEAVAVVAAPPYTPVVRDLPAAAPSRPRQCSVRQFSDAMVCDTCGHEWDVNDPCPPECYANKPE